MSWIGTMSERSRSALIAGLTAAAMLVVAGVVLALYDSQVYKDQKLREISVQAQILAATVTALENFSANDDALLTLLLAQLEDAGDEADRRGGPQHARLDGCHWKSAQKQSNLFFNNILLNGLNARHSARNLRDDAGHRRETIHSKRGKRLQICLQTGAGGTIRTSDTEGDGWGSEQWGHSLKL